MSKTADSRTVVLFGNPNPQMQVKVGDTQVSVNAEHLSQSVTRWEPSEEAFDEEFVALTLSTGNERALIQRAAGLSDEHRAKYAVIVHQAEEVMGAHAAGVAPTWVSCPSDLELQACLAGHFGCAEGEPVAVQTTAGRDGMHEQHLKSTGQPVGYEYGALSPSTVAPTTADTTLAEEIITASGGLVRKKMGFAHTAGTNTSTLIETWTANGSDSLPITIKRWANFNLAKQSEGSGKGIAESDALNSSATLSVSGDSITVTYTLTAG